ncbi:THUMP domain-containing class I SAM-dependent RNA methyltransferase [Oceaniglobus trochenteri]|uniref:THUMP domain-containing class I SAM-dependent RNA methyltransferase n=1 Tax=Oceaniglobus trochenteri TaxID=2763260 RepID=UPI001CFF7498|nr:class I SAM-dependent RNA methyltransferase [Oceaniglobus trochenteri]
MEPFDIFLVCAPGLEAPLADEARALGLAPGLGVGGVTVTGGWPDVWRCNLHLRCAARVLVRIGSFRVMHIAQLDKRARKFPFSDILRKDLPVRVEASCQKSRIYHDKAAKQRVEGALVAQGFTLAEDAPVTLKTRIEDDLCTFSLDTTGEPLHKRGHKLQVGKAPLRENLAAAFLRQCGFDGSEALVDPMCGSGTFVIEAAEIAAGLAPGRDRAFAFENLGSFDPAQWAALKSGKTEQPTLRFFGSDRDDGAIRSATANAERAGVSGFTRFTRAAISDLMPPDTPPGLVMVNPPYGARIGQRKLLFALYGSLGKVLVDRFKGWRVGIVTSDAGLAKATGLRFRPPLPPVQNGGLRIALYRTDPLR